MNLIRPEDKIDFQAELTNLAEAKKRLSGSFARCSPIWSAENARSFERIFGEVNGLINRLQGKSKGEKKVRVKPTAPEPEPVEEID